MWRRSSRQEMIQVGSMRDRNVNADEGSVMLCLLKHAEIPGAGLQLDS